MSPCNILVLRMNDGLYFFFSPSIPASSVCCCCCCCTPLFVQYGGCSTCHFHFKVSWSWLMKLSLCTASLIKSDLVPVTYKTHCLCSLTQIWKKCYNF